LLLLASRRNFCLEGIKGYKGLFHSAQDQTKVSLTVKKRDLRKLSEHWNTLSREEIGINTIRKRGHAPLENENSVIFQLWKKAPGQEISKPLPKEILQIKH